MLNWVNRGAQFDRTDGAVHARDLHKLCGGQAYRASALLDSGLVFHGSHSWTSYKIVKVWAQHPMQNNSAESSFDSLLRTLVACHPQR